MARHPGRGAARSAGFLLRWALRIGLPLAAIGALLQLFPYRATAGGVHFRVQGTILTRPGFSADTTFGSWQFRHVDGLPIGVHISPENVDLVTLAAAATQNGQAYAERLRGDIEHQLPAILAWLVGEALLGFLLGLTAAAAVNLAVAQLRRRSPGDRQWPHRTRQLAAAVGVLAVLAGYGAATYNPHWAKQSRVTGTLAALQLLPGQLGQYYQHRAKFFNVLGAIAGIQAQLQRHLDQRVGPATAFTVMFISDMHLAGTYPLLAQYAAEFGVRLIVNTGDESEFGTRAEMTPGYLAQIRALTAKAPMIWLAGNHDSPTTVSTMRSIKGVIVLGAKTARPDGGFTVTGQQVTADGLTIGAVPDPRVYGGPGAYGSNTPSVVDTLERHTMDTAVAAVPPTARFDIIASHEPVATAELAHDLPQQIRQTNAGHLHAQNPIGQVQHNGLISLVEGSTGAGGLDTINTGRPRVPIEFSIESVAADCQFTKLVRFQIAGPPPTGTSQPPPAAQQVTASTLYLKPQHLTAGRSCTTSQGISPVTSLDATP